MYVFEEHSGWGIAAGDWILFFDHYEDAMDFALNIVKEELKHSKPDYSHGIFVWAGDYLPGELIPQKDSLLLLDWTDGEVIQLNNQYYRDIKDNKINEYIGYKTFKCNSCNSKFILNKNQYKWEESPDIGCNETSNQRYICTCPICGERVERKERITFNELKRRKDEELF